jgi:hypothetical protein
MGALSFLFISQKILLRLAWLPDPTLLDPARQPDISNFIFLPL